MPPFVYPGKPGDWASASDRTLTLYCIEIMRLTGASRYFGAPATAPVAELPGRLRALSHQINA